MTNKNLFTLSNLKVRSKGYKLVYDNDCKAYRQKHTIEVSNFDGVKKYFTWTSQTLKYIPANKGELLENVLASLYFDFLTYESYDIVTFIKDFSYENKEGKKVWKLLKGNHNRLQELFTDNTLNDIENHYKNY